MSRIDKETCLVPEYDACAIIALLDKHGRARHANITRTLDTLKKMGHRSGNTSGEGDGCGLMTDLPRRLWEKRLAAAGLSPGLAGDGGFCVGHFLLPCRLRACREEVLEGARGIFARHGMKVLLEIEGATDDRGLGMADRQEPPLFWQLAGIVEKNNSSPAELRLFNIVLEMEKFFPALHTMSLSTETSGYKVRGGPDQLQRVYPELRDPENQARICLGHSRYSTNTLPTVERAQPFSLLAHNGEINTIERLRAASGNLGIPPVPGGSDSQDLNRCIEGLIHGHGFTALEAFAMVFPAVYAEAVAYPPRLRRLYEQWRWFFPVPARGPAAIVARQGDTCLGSVDALGLRPLWYVESEDSYFLSSEKGVVDLENTVSDPVPLAPGEKIAFICRPGRKTVMLDHQAYQERLVELARNLNRPPEKIGTLYRKIPASRRNSRSRPEPEDSAPNGGQAMENPGENLLAAFGWRHYDLEIRRRAVIEGDVVIGSMGYQEPLACLDESNLLNLSEYFKESVAVVTNPAVDREREIDHFSTRVILGARPTLRGPGREKPVDGLELSTPLLLGGRRHFPRRDRALSALAGDFGTRTIEEVIEFFTAGNREPRRAVFLDATFVPGNGLERRLEEIRRAAENAAGRGALLLVLDDSRSFSGRRVFIDPGLVLASTANHLEEKGLRRKCSLIVRSAAVRNLHDIMFLLGLDADAVNPGMLWEVSGSLAPAGKSAHEAIRATMTVLQEGMEKVLSTMGIHELCGYGRIFASIGLSEELQALFRSQNFCASPSSGISFASLEEAAGKRLERAGAGVSRALERRPDRNARTGRLLRRVATGEIGFLEMGRELAALERERPVALRHALDFRRPADTGARPADSEVDISVGDHAMPLVISAMSFGSQGESSFRAYAEAAKKLNIISMNGEGGEIPDMLGRYRRNRGQQVASGRFGVDMEFLCSADYLEIKIGQGAKPGEGGHLPASKVTPMVAAARRCKPGITLISPSNNHDIYSIEDLAQLITELKTANEEARVSVKIPVTGSVGPIAVGIAKAGADIVSLSGYDGGSGAAREHSRKYVGLPVEIGVSRAHRALVESGLRDKVEIWCDGGLRGGADVLKLIMMGADRAGLGTAPLMAMGCISCRRCHLDTCPRGIATQAQSVAEAEKRGIRRFQPLKTGVETDNLVRLLSSIGAEMRHVLAGLGFTRLRDVVGRTDLLGQVACHSRVSLDELLSRPASGPVIRPEGRRLAGRPLNFLTRMIADITLSELDGAEDGEVEFRDRGVRSVDRAVGTRLAGALIRRAESRDNGSIRLHLDSSVPGNGLCAFNIPGIEVTVEGGAQDGTAKSSSGGSCGIFKGVNLSGHRVDGSTGKSFAYGATGGTLMVQNIADSRACIRMSGADAIFGARITGPVDDRAGNLAVKAHLKGFAFEYMTGGRAVVLGDPGPWICSGMTGGVIYLCLYPEYGFNLDSVRRRLARAAEVTIEPVDETGRKQIAELLAPYVDGLRATFQAGEADEVERLLAEAERRFVMVRPSGWNPRRPE